MPSPVEVNKLYSYPQDVCYSIIKDHVIPSMSIAYRIAYLNIKIPYGSMGLSIIEDDWRAYMLTAKMSYKGLASYTWGPPIRIYCRSTGPDTTMVEIVADAAKYFDGKFVNFLMDTAYKRVPVYSWFLRRIVPDIYFDDTRIVDSQRLKEKSFGDDLGRVALHHVFQTTHCTLEMELKKGHNAR